MNPKEDKEESPQSSVDERLVLCSMPQEWSSLPVHPPYVTPPTTSTISVYTPGRRRSLRYIGYICPLLPSFVTPLHMDPPRPSRGSRHWVSWRRRHLHLLERIRTQDRLFQERPSPVLPPSESRQAEPIPPAPPSQDTPPAAPCPPAPQPDRTYPLAEEVLEREISMLNLQCVDGVWCPADDPSPAAPEEENPRTN